MIKNNSLNSSTNKFWTSFFRAFEYQYENWSTNSLVFQSCGTTEGRRCLICSRNKPRALGRFGYLKPSRRQLPCLFLPSPPAPQLPERAINTLCCFEIATTDAAPKMDEMTAGYGVAWGAWAISPKEEGWKIGVCWWERVSGDYKFG